MQRQMLPQQTTETMEITESMARTMITHPHRLLHHHQPTTVRMGPTTITSVKPLLLQPPKQYPMQRLRPLTVSFSIILILIDHTDIHQMETTAITGNTAPTRTIPLHLHPQPTTVRMAPMTTTSVKPPLLQLLKPHLPLKPHQVTVSHIFIPSSASKTKLTFPDGDYGNYGEYGTYKDYPAPPPPYASYGSYKRAVLKALGWN
jgi:hypothetical protein